MILANSTWGAWLASCGVPAIYRSQASLAPGVKVRMGTHPAPHAGIGVAQYAWSTSPLRRYVDLVNQWQIVACARHGRTAGLIAPFKPKDTGLLAAIADFDASYAAYNAFQAQIERYWSLRWLQQNAVGELAATVLKDGLVRAETLPLVFRAIGSEQLARGSAVRVRVGAIDLLTLDLAASVVARLGDEASATVAAEAGEDDEDSAAGPLSIAIDVAAPDAAVEPDPAAAPA
jgi:exoribonuclease-2